MVDHSMMEFPDMRGMSVQNVVEMKNAENQTFTDTKEKGSNATVETKEADCHAQELTAPFDVVKYSKHNKFPLYFDDSVNSLNP